MVMATSSSVAGGGYEYQFLTTPADWLICNICHFPSKEPYLSDCCGHTFCKSCLEGAKRATTIANVCPICRSVEFITFRNKQADRLVRSLCVFCTNKEKGCEWQGEVNDIIKHLGNSDGCQFEEVSCSNDCGKCLQRQYLTSHIGDECVRRKIDCQYCHTTGEHQFIKDEHKKQCPKLPITCPNKCEVGSVPRDDIEEHIKLCTQEVIQCEYHVVGCEERMVRKNQKTHNKQKMEEHLYLAVSTLNTTKQQLATTCQHLAKAEKEHITLAVNTNEALVKLETKFETKVTEIETAAQKRITELENKLEQKTQQIEWIYDSNIFWYNSINYKASKLLSGEQIVPVIVKMPEYSNMKKHAYGWHSTPFYTHHGGYKMCLYIQAAGWGSDQTILPVFLYLMKGPYDDQLRWPLKGHCEVKLLNQISNSEHHYEIGVHNKGKGIERVTENVSKNNSREERSTWAAWNSCNFIANKDLHKITPARQYLRDDSIFLQVDYKLD